MLVLQTCRIQKLWGQKNFYLLSIESRRGQVVCPWEDSAWNEKCSGGPKNLEKPGTWDIWEELHTMGRKRRNWGCGRWCCRIRVTQSFGVFMLLKLTPSARHKATGFNICPSWFQSSFDPFTFYPHIPSLGMEMLSLCHCVLEVFCFVLFIWVQSQEFVLSLERDFGLVTGLFNSAWTVKPLVTFREGLNACCINKRTWVFGGQGWMLWFIYRCHPRASKAHWWGCWVESDWIMETIQLDVRRWSIVERDESLWVLLGKASLPPGFSRVLVDTWMLWWE